MASVRRNGHQFIADINITPFTDVVLVLLIIFMIATPLIMLEGIKVTLPVSKKQTEPVKAEDVFVKVSISSNGVISVDGQGYRLDQLRPLLEQAMKNNPASVVSIAADPDTIYERVVQVVDSARAAGVKRYVLAR